MPPYPVFICHSTFPAILGGTVVPVYFSLIGGRLVDGMFSHIVNKSVTTYFEIGGDKNKNIVYLYMIKWLMV